MISGFKKVLCADVLIDVNRGSVAGQSSIVIRESGCNSAVNKLTITDVPDNSVAFTLDFDSGDGKFSQLSNYLNKGNGDGINSSCDLVIVSSHDDKLRVVIFDQKSKDPNLEKTFIQLLNSREFVSYLIRLIKCFYVNSFDVHSVDFFCSMGTTRVVKQSVNASVLSKERERRNKLQALGFREVLIKPDRGVRCGTIKYGTIAS